MGTKSNIYTVNSTSTAVVEGGTIPLGTATRRYGQCINLNGNSITLNGNGYYDVDVTATFTGAVGNATITLFKDGVAVPGATATTNIATANTQVASVSFPAIIKVRCCEQPANLTLVLTGVGVTFSNVAVSAIKI